MKILITGGAGFIGSYLAEKLLKAGHSIYILDNLSTSSLDNIQHLLKNPKLVFKKGSVLDQRVLAPLVKKSDQIYHLAAAVGVKLVVEKPLDSFLTNLYGTHNVLTLAAEKKIPVLITSSSEVYGKNSQIPCEEDDDRIYGSVYNERWGYALSKTADEFMALAYWRERGLPVVVVRLFNTVGSRQTARYGMVIPRLVEQALAGEPLTVYGDGRQIRSFSYVGDIVEGMIRLLNSKKCRGEIFNLGSPDPVTIKDLALRIKKLTRSHSPIKFLPYQKVYGKTFEDMHIRVPDVSKAERFVGYRPNFLLDEILKEIIDHHSV